MHGNRIVDQTKTKTEPLEKRFISSALDVSKWFRIIDDSILILLFLFGKDLSRLKGASWARPWGVRRKWNDHNTCSWAACLWSCSTSFLVLGTKRRLLGRFAAWRLESMRQIRSTVCVSCMRCRGEERESGHDHLYYIYLYTCRCICIYHYEYLYVYICICLYLYT